MKTVQHNLYIKGICGLLFFILCTSLGFAKEEKESEAIQSAQGVLQRWLPNHVTQFILEEIPQENGQDVFELESKDNRIILRGSNGLSICTALNYYLKYYALADISWCGIQCTLPKTLPPVDKKIHEQFTYPYRYFINYCCFGYTMPWWNWEQWQFFIDWMALNGVNMPLSVTGLEGVWQSVLRKAGLPEEDIDKFLAGPPYLPFGWMGCLDGWGGTLSQNWIDKHLDLQKNILERERSLGMKPVLQGFTGHVPPSLTKVYPDLKLQKIKWIDWETYFMDANDPRFTEFGKLFMEEQIRQFGTDHLYAADTFIEMSPPSNDPAFLRNLGKTIYGSLTSADPEATWVMQGWIFYNNAQFWKPEQSKAFLSEVPDNKMILLDLYCDENSVWDKTDSFYGKQWIWNILQSFGDTVAMTGPLAKINNDYFAAANSPQKGKLTGIGMVPEGLNDNPVIYDFLFELGWRNEKADMTDWIQKYAGRRYGKILPEAREAWQLLEKTVYSRSQHSASTVVIRPGFQQGCSFSYSLPEFLQAWNRLRQCQPSLKDIDTYQFDLVNVTREALTRLSNDYHRAVIEAYSQKDEHKFLSSSEKFLQLLSDIDRLLATRKEFLLGCWLEDAKRWGITKDEKNNLEWNARNVIALWGNRNSELHEYSNREWSGMISGLYIPSWKLFFNRLETSLQQKQAFDKDAFTEEIKKVEEQWTHQTNSYPDHPQGDSVQIATELYTKYIGDFIPSIEISLQQQVWQNLEKVIQEMNNGHLAKNKPAVATASLDQYPPSKAVDGNLLNRESSWQSAESPASLTVDLGEEKQISRIHAYPYWDGSRYYQYTIEVSLNGNDWQKVVDYSTNTRIATPYGDDHKIAPVTSKFVRINMLHNSANQGVHLIELAVFDK